MCCSVVYVGYNDVSRMNGLCGEYNDIERMVRKVYVVYIITIVYNSIGSSCNKWVVYDAWSVSRCLERI